MCCRDDGELQELSPAAGLQLVLLSAQPHPGCGSSQPSREDPGNVQPAPRPRQGAAERSLCGGSDRQGRHGVPVAVEARPGLLYGTYTYAVRQASQNHEGELFGFIK